MKSFIAKWIFYHWYGKHRLSELIHQSGSKWWKPSQSEKVELNYLAKLEHDILEL